MNSVLTTTVVGRAAAAPSSISDDQAALALTVLLDFLRTAHTGAGEACASLTAIEWEIVVAVAEAHRVVPQLLAALRVARPAGSESAVKSLEANALRVAQRNLELTQALLSVVAECRARGVVVAPYKGPALAQQLFGSIALRQMNDVDVLVLEPDIAAASDVLVALGYRLEPPADRVPRGAYLRHACEYAFRNGSGVNVELHWRVLPPAFPFTVDLAGMFARAQWTDLCGTTVPTFCSEDVLLLLSLHGLKHLFFQLRWICDIAQLVALGLDWPLALARAKESRATRTVLLAAAVARDLLDAQLPESVAAQIHSDPEIVRLVREVRMHLGDSHAEDRRGRHGFYARALSGPRDRFLYAFRTLTSPTEAEWGTARLPGPLYPVYRIARLSAGTIRGWGRRRSASS